jgi:AraC-like DNA-binding protein
VELGVTGVVHLARAGTDDPALTAAVWRLGEVTECGGAAPLEVQTLQAVVLRHMLTHAERPPRAPGTDEFGATGRARDYLCVHRCEPVTLDDLTAVAGIGRFQLLRAFQRRFGVPPHAFQTQLRVERARAMLRSGIAPAFVSAETGFYDQSHFGRHFRKIVGVTPGEYTRGRRSVHSMPRR